MWVLRVVKINLACALNKMQNRTHLYDKGDTFKLTLVHEGLQEL